MKKVIVVLLLLIAAFTVPAAITNNVVMENMHSPRLDDRTSGIGKTKSIQFNYTATEGYTYVVQYSTDNKNWTNLFGTLQFSDMKGKIVVATAIPIDPKVGHMSFRVLEIIPDKPVAPTPIVDTPPAITPATPLRYLREGQRPVAPLPPLPPGLVPTASN